MLNTFGVTPVHSITTFLSLSAQKLSFPAKAAELRSVAAAFELHGFYSVEDLNGADVALLDGNKQLAGRARALARSIVGFASRGARSLLACMRYFLSL